MKKLLYIHGYNGSPDGGSCQKFRKYMPADEWQVIGMDYNQEDCSVALQQIRETIEREKIDLVVGSSLGGFLSLLTTGIERIVINPCYSPSVELPKLGPHNGLPAPSPKMVATYAAFEPQLKTFSEEERKLITGYFAKEDELLGDNYKEIFRKDIGSFTDIPGGHHLSEEAVDMICKNKLTRNIELEVF
ncbi:MAG: YqiA/YcfP family alpha/beta fold hydrolase [Bacteroidales bacterium]|nr:YqiA/YcfP family alpha/beta fold hydrolase [Bacteroidales bacterium]